jgi:hypothetical protein
MTDIGQHLTSLDDELDNLTHDDIQGNGGLYRTMNIFNNNIKIPLKKIWLLTPKLKLLGKVHQSGKILTAGNLSVILYELDDAIKKFREFVDKIETKVGEILEEITGDCLTLKSAIKTCDTFFPSLTLQLVLDKNNIFDNSNELIKYDSIDNGSFILAYIEVGDVWLNYQYYGINFNVLQMKVYPEFDFTKCIFTDGPPKIKGMSSCFKYGDDDDEECGMAKSMLPIKKRGGPVTQLFKKVDNDVKMEVRKVSPKKESGGMFLQLSVGELISAKNKLKSAVFIDKEIVDNDKNIVEDGENVIVKNDIINNENVIVDEEIIVKNDIVDDIIVEEPIIKPPIKKKKKKVRKIVKHSNDDE